MKYKFLLWLLLGAIKIFALKQDTLILNNQHEKIDIKGSEYYLFTNHDISFDNILDANFSSKAETDFGFLTGILWVKFIIQNKGDETRFVLHASDGHISGMYLFKPNARTYSMTTPKRYHPEDGREVFNRIPAFFIDIKKNETKVFFLKITPYNEIVNLSYLVETQSSYAKSVQTDYLIIGLYFGALLIIVIVNVFYYISLKDNLYLIYAFYVISSILVTATLDGFVWLLTPSSDVAYHLNFFLLRLWPDCLLFFTCHLVTLKETNKRLYVVCYLFIFYHTIIMAALDFINPADIRSKVMAPWEIINWMTAILLVCLVIAFSYKSNKYLFRYYLIAYGVLIIMIIFLSMHSLSAQNWLFFEHALKLGTVIEIITLSFAVSRRFKLTELSLKLKKEAEKQLTVKITQLQMNIKKTQMNPHFMFNALTSIQYFIMKHNAVQAKNYLEKFALLMRLTLDNSRSSFIPLQNELNALRYYIELEFLRMKNVCHQFEISISKDLDTNKVYIPGLLIQPFVENAIWHGLHCKNTPGKLLIHIHLKENQLECTVEDSGQGIQSTKGSTKRKSSGIQITRERLTLIHTSLGSQFKFVLIDLNAIDENQTGVRAFFNIPYTTLNLQQKSGQKVKRHF